MFKNKKETSENFKEENEALCCAAKNGHNEIIKKLITMGAEIGCRDDRVLRLASSWGRTSTVELLLSLGIGEGRGEKSLIQTCYILALENGHEKTAMVLINYATKETSVNARDTGAETLEPEEVLCCIEFIEENRRLDFCSGPSRWYYKDSVIRSTLKKLKDYERLGVPVYKTKIPLDFTLEETGICLNAITTCKGIYKENNSSTFTGSFSSAIEKLKTHQKSLYFQGERYEDC